MSRCLLFLLLASAMLAVAMGDLSDLNHVFAPTINMENFTETTDRRFMSVAVGARTLVRTYGGNPQFHVESQRFYTLVKGLSPTSVRLGGSYSNFFIFNPSDELETDNNTGIVPQNVIDEWEIAMNGSKFWGDTVYEQSWKNVAFTGGALKRLTDYLKKVHWELVLDVNQNLMSGGQWDSFNFRLMLDYMIKHDIKVEAFQLGNEAVLMPKKLRNLNITAASTAKDYKALRAVLDEYPEFVDVPIHGPETTSLARSGSSRTWFKEFLNAGGGSALGVIGLHHYYLSGVTSVYEDYINPDLMDSFKRLPDEVNAEKAKHGLEHLPVHLTETADAYSGGNPDYSRTVLSSFIFVDQLGLCAKGGIKRVHRQTFNSGAYSLINRNELVPHPDYYVALTHKRIIHGPVLDITLTPANNTLRIYAHCARVDYYNYPKGAVVVYFSNLFNETIGLNFNETFPKVPNMDLYIFQSSEGYDLSSNHVNLNGKLLEMSKIGRLPDIVATKAAGRELRIPGFSFGFVVVTNANAPACVNRPEEKYVKTEHNIFQPSEDCRNTGFLPSESGRIPHNSWSFY